MLFYQMSFLKKIKIWNFRMIQSLALQKDPVKFLLTFSHLIEPANEYSHPNMVLNL